MSKENVVLEIVVGTYEKFLLGYFLELHSDEFCLKPSFVTEPHLQSVRCIASSDKYFASGSADERIHLFSIKTRKEIGSIMHHNGTVTSLEFYDSYLISSSEDKSICIWSTSNWECLKSLLGHKKSVNCISIHPSGKMALSVSKDNTLRTWNLIKGISAYVSKIQKDAELVKWVPDGLHFVVVHSNSIDIYSVESASILRTINFQHKICDLTFINESVCAVCGYNEMVSFYDVTTGNLCYEFKAHKTRVKAIKFASVNGETFLITASTDGLIKVWHVQGTDLNFKTQRVAKVKTGCRLTCLTIMTAQISE